MCIQLFIGSRELLVVNVDLSLKRLPFKKTEIN